MKTLLLAAAFIIAIYAVAPAQTLTDCYNGVGLFLTQQPTTHSWFQDVLYFGEPGAITLYAVLLNPYNENTGSPIANLGGYEFQIVPRQWGDGGLPPVQYTVLAGMNFMTPPDFYCGANVPLVDGQVLLLSVEIVIVEGDEIVWFIEPVRRSGAQSIPGEIAVTDADDSFSLSRATPVNYDFGVPVACLNTEACISPVLGGGSGGAWGDCWPVDTEERSWGDIKAMFR